MKSFRVNLLTNNRIWVGQISHQEDVLRVFHTRSIDLLEHFSKTHKEILINLEGAFAYWISSELGQPKKKRTQYDVLTRKLNEYDEQLSRAILNEAFFVAKKIKKFQLAHKD